MSSASASVPAGSGDEKRGGEPQLSAQLAAYRHICRGIVPPHAVWHRAAGAPEIVHKPVIGGPALQEKASEWDSALLSRLRARQQELRDVPPNLPEPLQQAVCIERHLSVIGRCPCRRGLCVVRSAGAPATKVQVMLLQPGGFFHAILL